MLPSNVLLAPMAGITDYPFRQCARHFGVGLAYSEMTTSDLSLLNTPKTRERLIKRSEQEPRATQLVGNDPKAMVDAALFQRDIGAQIIDINMGCPAKKVVAKAAGSALLGDLKQVEAIISAVVNAVDVPVTLKIRTGLSPALNNGPEVAMLAEALGVQCLTVHGRSRADKFKGEAEYHTIKRIKQCVSIPVIANGDITSGKKAQQVLEYTGANGVMIGRGAYGQPWLPAQINQYLNNVKVKEISIGERNTAILNHVRAIHIYYGAYKGVLIARKHIKWYLQVAELDVTISKKINQLSSADEVIYVLKSHLDQTQANKD